VKKLAVAAMQQKREEESEPAEVCTRSPHPHAFVIHPTTCVSSISAAQILAARVRTWLALLIVEENEV
jgi:hypothetical protein